MSSIDVDINFAEQQIRGCEWDIAHSTDPAEIVELTEELAGLIWERDRLEQDRVTQDDPDGALAAYTEKRDSITQLLDSIHAKLEADAKQPITWGLAHSLEYAEDLLRELDQFLS